MQINPVDNSELMVTAIRDYLRKTWDDWRCNAATNAFLIEQLPQDWRQLIRYHGHVPVFWLLAANFTLSAAREQLNGTL